jgi:hypothetical protein
LLIANGLIESATRDLSLRLGLRNHSPTGFGWGYGNSGPAQLALAFLKDAVGDELAHFHNQDFESQIHCGGEAPLRVRMSRAQR